MTSSSSPSSSNFLALTPPPPPPPPSLTTEMALQHRQSSSPSHRSHRSSTTSLMPPTSSTTLGGGATTPPTTMYISSSSGRSAVEEDNDEDDIERYFTRAVYITTDPMSATKTPSPTSDVEDNDKSIRATIVGGGNNVLVAESPTLVGFADAKKKPLSMSSTTTGRGPSSYSYEGGHQDLLLLDEPPTVARLVSVASLSSSSSS